MSKLKFSFTLIFSLFIAHNSFSQVENEGDGIFDKDELNPISIDDNGIKKKDEDSSKTDVKTLISDYKFWTENSTKQILDTTLTIKSYHRANFLNRDLFGTMPWSNIGQNLSFLKYNPNDNFIPDMGFSAKKTSYQDFDQIRYFDVKSPLTQFDLITGMREGVALKSLFSHSLSKYFNYTLQYNGVRSLGRYNQQLANIQKFIFSTNFRTQNNRYKLLLHYAYQGADNEENGGITNNLDFESNNPRFINRRNLQLNLDGVTTEYSSRRFYLSHSFDFLNKKNIKLGVYHRLNSDNKKYYYTEDKTNDFISKNVFDKVARKSSPKYEKLSNELGLQININDKISAKLGIRKTDISHKYDTTLVSTIPPFTEDKIMSLHSMANVKLSEKLSLNANISYVLSADKFKDSKKISAFANYKIDDDNTVKISVKNNSSYPSLNYFLHQSFYKDYNWKNDFKTVNTTSFHLDLKSKKIADLSINYYDIKNYASFINFKPEQYSSDVNIYNIEVRKDLLLWSFPMFKKHKYPWQLRLDNSILYQNYKGSSVLHLPNFVTRNVIYIQGHMFDKKPLFAQFGLEFNYHSKYFADEFSPVLNEFSTQYNTQIGGFPRMTLFANGKVKRMRFYLKWQHFNSLFSKRDYYSSPDYPYVDWIIRAGISWKFFN